MSVKKYENELEIIKEIYKWSFNGSLDADFYDQLSKSRDALISALGETEIKTPAFCFEVHVKWDCPICSSNNEFIGNQEDTDYYDLCPTCGLKVCVIEG